MNIPFAAALLGYWARRQSRIRTIESLEPVKVERVLLVLTTGIGDAIFSTAVFPSLRQAMPQAEIRLFCRTAWQDLFAADADLDGVIPYFGKFRRVLETVRRLRAYRPDLVLVLHGNDPDVLPLCALSGAPYVVRIPATGTRFGDLLSNRLRSADQATLPETHYIDNRVRILDTIGVPVVSRVPQVVLDAGVQQAVVARVRERLGGRPYWVLHVHAANPYKSLPDAVAQQLVRDALAAFPDHGLVLSGGPADRAALLKLVPRALADRVVLTAGEMNLTESAACLAGATVVMAPDTGILHLAAALDRPVIGLFAPTSPTLVGPRTRTAPVQTLVKPLTCEPCLQKRCPHRPVLCMAQFSTGELLAALKKVL